MSARLLALVGAALLPFALVAVEPAPSPAVAAPLVAADSSEWENLQVLPDSLTRDELTAIMQRLTQALGVNCAYCHVRRDGAWDFPSDDKAHKTAARGMMRMTWRLNHDVLPEMEGLGGHGPLATVTCWTCHRGQSRPMSSPADTVRSEHHH